MMTGSVPVLNPPRVQLGVESCPIKLPLSFSSPTSKSTSEILPSLNCNNSMSNDISVVAGGRTEVNRCSLLHGGESADAGAGRSLPDSLIITDQRRGSDAPHGDTRTLHCKQGETSRSI